MNTNPQAKVVLCFGDSNTWGDRPDGEGRFPADIRWTGQLQNILGNDYYVIEEGRGGRTTNIEDPERAGRNGITYFNPCVASHSPLDYIVIMLGTNDQKNKYNVTARDIAEALKDYVQLAREQAPAAKIILVSPVYVEARHSQFDENTVKKSHDQARFIQQVAEEMTVAFIDAASITKVGEDGIHLDEASQRPLAGAIANIIEIKI